MVTVDCFLDDIEKAFSEIKRILKRNGVLVVAFLDRETLLGRLYEKNKHLHRSYMRATFHSADEMTVFLEQAGFTITERKQTVFVSENVSQEVKKGTGEGVFAVFKASAGTD